jgi:hypothetical protein
MIPDRSCGLDRLSSLSAYNSALLKLLAKRGSTDSEDFPLWLPRLSAPTYLQELARVLGMVLAAPALLAVLAILLGVCVRVRDLHRHDIARQCGEECCTIAEPGACDVNISHLWASAGWASKKRAHECTRSGAGTSLSDTESWLSVPSARSRSGGSYAWRARRHFLICKAIPITQVIEPTVTYDSYAVSERRARAETCPHACDTARSLWGLGCCIVFEGMALYEPCVN